MKANKKAIIIGAGPAGLTAAYELIKNSNIKPIIFELSDEMGGISKTINYKGNRIDIGGHRFFSKSELIMNWWSNILPIQNDEKGKNLVIKYQGKTQEVKLPKAGNDTDEVMLVRSRLSRIYYEGKFYNYPIGLEMKTINNLGLIRILKMGVSYSWAKIKPLKENNLEDFYINRFGRVLYETFFRDYTEKVWGVPCNQIAADWGAQRVKGLSISGALTHAIKKQFKKAKQTDINQKNTETSLIEYFLYPKYGPGQMWEKVARIVKDNGGEIHTKKRITKIITKNTRVVAVEVFDESKKTKETISGDYFFSTMPVKELINQIEGTKVPEKIMKIANGLPYRDFITVGILVDKLSVKNDAGSNKILDNWIYIQEPSVKVGRLQIFNNWSPYMVKDSKKIWIGMEYFVNENDELWNKSKKEMSEFAVNELASIGIIKKKFVRDTVVIKIKKTYPAYFGTYGQFKKLQQFIDKFENLFLIGRNGQHKYNNQDHSMLTAIEAVSNIINGKKDKRNIWNVNLEKEYHEKTDTMTTSSKL